MFAMAGLLGDMTSGVQAPFGTGKERSGGRPAPQSRRDQANSSFEIGRAPGEQSEIREGVKKRLAHIRGRLSCGEANEQAAHWRSASESNQIAQELAAIQGAGKAQEATPLDQTAAPAQEPRRASLTRQEQIQRHRWQTAEKTLATERRQRKALKEAGGWVYWPELKFLRHSKGAGEGEEKRFGLKPTENTFGEFMKVILDLFLGMIRAFLDAERKKSGHSDEMYPA